MILYSMFSIMSGDYIHYQLEKSKLCKESFQVNTFTAYWNCPEWTFNFQTYQTDWTEQF